MPQIKPFEFVPELPSELENILVENGVASKSAPTKDLDLAAARKALNTHGAGIDDVAQTIAQVMQLGDSDTIKLRASELALKVHGVLNEIENKSIPTINITIQGTENKALINLVLPT